MKKRKSRQLRVCMYVLMGVVLAVVVLLWLTTGFFSPGNINERDKGAWEYGNDVITGASAFTLEGKTDTCWLMIHGYSSTPDDYRTLAPAVNTHFNEKVVVPRLVGHGEVPGNLLTVSFDDWYVQMEKEYADLANECGNVNVVGYSMGGAVTLKLAEEYDLNNVYVISPYLILRYKFWHMFTLKTYVTLFGDALVYLKLPSPGQINDPEGGLDYIAYRSFPLPPIKNSFVSIEYVKDNLHTIEENILVLQSENDIVVDIDSSHLIMESVASPNKELVVFSESNHVLLFDYEQDEAIEAIIDFETRMRESL